MYLTPDRFRTMGLGVDLSDVEDVELQSAITRATADINSVCAVPRLPQQHDFRGGVITGERHDWVIDPYERPHPNRVYLNHTPVVSVERLWIYSDHVNHIAIDVDQLVINNSGGYVEISSLLLTQYGVFGAGIVPFIGLFNPIIEVDYTYRYEFAITDEVAEATDAQTYQAQNQFWIPGKPVIVKVNGVTKTETTDYTIDRTEGQITFTANQPADAVVTVSYWHSLPWEISQACGVIVAGDISEALLTSKGMAGLESMRVQSGGGAAVEIQRPRLLNRNQQAASVLEDLPPRAARLLFGYNFVSAR